MILFIRNIPANTKNEDLRKYVEPALKTGFLCRSRRGSITKLEEMCIRDKATGHIQYHGLVYLDNRKAGLRVVKKLNGKFLGDCALEVRQYQIRMLENDKRLAMMHPPTEIPDIPDRRNGDRRRHGDEKDMFKRNL